MNDANPWRFYGRREELSNLEEILGRGRWFFLRLSGRRRIGKTSLIQQALGRSGSPPSLYVQIPDSSPTGVLSTVADTLRIFDVDPELAPPPQSLAELADLIGVLVRRGYIVVLDEFQYFNRKVLRPFTSELQRVVDALASEADRVPGGLVVLGSIHADLVALIEDRRAPLFNRTTDELELRHLDIASILEILSVHADPSPSRLLTLWNLFEGVPKFYRDAYEQDALAGARNELLRRMFFRSSSPLRNEAEHWFLNELRGRYDVVLKYVARHPGCTHADLMAHVQTVSQDSKEQVGGYLQALVERFELVEKRLPIFAAKSARRHRYYIRDNFLRSWLSALGPAVQAVNFRPVEKLVEQAASALETAEGYGFERLVGVLYEERSRKGRGDFELTQRISGYWDRNDVEIDLVALDEVSQRIRFGSCKRSAERLVEDRNRFRGHVERFLKQKREYADWRIEHVMLTPVISAAQRKILEGDGFLVEDLGDLCAPLMPLPPSDP